jgi:hypothetical protein
MTSQNNAHKILARFYLDLKVKYGFVPTAKMVKTIFKSMQDQLDPETLESTLQNFRKANQQEQSLRK